MEGAIPLVLLVLLGVLVGAAVPALLQLRRTLQSAERFLERTGGKLETTLDEVAAVSSRIQKLLDGIERGGAAPRPDAAAIVSLLSSFGGIGESLRKAFLVLSALGPVVAAILGTLRRSQGSGDEHRSPKASEAQPRAEGRPEPSKTAAPSTTTPIPEGRPS